MKEINHWCYFVGNNITKIRGGGGILKLNGDSAAFNFVR